MRRAPPHAPVLLLCFLPLVLSEAGPWFTIEPRPVYANTGEVVEFECAASGIPAPRIVWYKNSQRIRITGHISQETITYSHKKLRVTGVRYEADNGDYSCEADNKMGVIRSRKARLHAPYLLKDRDYFLEEPKPTYSVYPGAGTVIPCRYQPAASWPKAQIFWRKLIDENRFENIGSIDSRVISRYGTMVITSTRPEDSGTYRCGARNIKMGTIAESDKTKITVESGTLRPVQAEIYVAETSIRVVRGETAVLECIPFGTPPATIIWSRERGPTPDKAVVSQNSVLLTIPALSSADAGRYYCSAQQSGAVVVQRFIDLTLLEPPEFMMSMKNLTVLEGGTLTIPCDCAGSPDPQVTWFMNTEKITTNINPDNSLVLSEAKAITSGMYQCQADNEVGSAQATFAVKVIGPARIVSEPQPKTVAQGTNVTLTCEAVGSPTPGIVWLKDGNPLPSNSRIRHHENLYESTIYINNIQISDNGMYECKAINENGVDSMLTKISVEGPPYINVKPRDISGITGSDILVQCEATASPIPNIIWYRNELRLSESEKYDYTEQGLLIRGAHAVDGGSFMCQAQNSMDSISSAPVQVTVYNVPAIEHRMPPSTNVTAGKTGVLLQCGLTKDYSEYQWYRRGIPLLNVYFGDNTTPRIETRNGVGLYFYSVLPEDQGQYSCNVSNPAATASISGHLFVDVFPSITFISKTKEVREYETFWLHCSYEGEPRPTLEWSHNNTPLRREHTIFSNGTLRITSATRFDSGAYQCGVTNRQGSKRRDVIITVRSKARIENLPSLQYPITDQQSTLICEVSGYPHPKVEWRINGDRIETYNNNGYSRSGTNLVIVSPERTRHDGLYTCKASNDYGADEGMARVQVLDLPAITRINGCGAVKAGLECKMTCEATGHPLPSLTWRYKQGNVTVVAESDNSRSFVSLVDIVETQQRELALTIKELRASDSRIYYCHAENPAGKTSKSYQLSVRHQAVIETPPLLNYEFPIGATLTISCRARGEPEPQITWKKDRGNMPPNGRSKVDELGSLIIVNIQPEDVGEYTCTANNNNEAADFEFDTVSASTTVKVTSKDSALTVIDNPIETWLIVVIVICVFVVCIVVFVSVKMIRDKNREKRSYKPTQMTSKTAEEPNYQYETVTPKPVSFHVPLDSSNSLPMYNIRTLNWGEGGKHPPNNFQSQFDDVDRQLQGLLKDLDNPKIDNLESDI